MLSLFIDAESSENSIVPLFSITYPAFPVSFKAYIPVFLSPAIVIVPVLFTSVVPAAKIFPGLYIIAALSPCVDVIVPLFLSTSEEGVEEVFSKNIPVFPVPFRFIEPSFDISEFAVPKSAVAAVPPSVIFPLFIIFPFSANIPMEFAPARFIFPAVSFTNVT